MGHIHFGYEGLTYEQMLNLTRLADLFISVPLIFVQSNKERRKMYGAAGAMRCVENRVEFRSPSNYYWTSKEGLEWVFKQLETMVNFYNESKENMDKVLGMGALIITALNNDDKDVANTLMAEFNITPFPVEELVG